MLSQPRLGHHMWVLGGVAPGALLVLAATTGALSCYTHGETTCGQESEPRAPLQGSVMVRADGEASPGAGSLVFVELCGLYTDNPDPAKGHPNYRYSALADADGNFRIDVPRGTVGLHTFLEGYTYGFAAVSDSTAPGVRVVNAEAIGARPVPTIKSFTVSPTDARPGDTLTFSLDVTAPTSDPISDEVLLAEPVSGIARAFGPPRRGQPGKGFPSGTWTVTLQAPSSGAVTYYAQAVTEQCAVSGRLEVQVNVR